MEGLRPIEGACRTARGTEWEQAMSEIRLVVREGAKDWSGNAGRALRPATLGVPRAGCLCRLRQAGGDRRRQERFGPDEPIITGDDELAQEWTEAMAADKVERDFDLYRDALSGIHAAW